MSSGDPLVLVTGASQPIATRLIERTAGQGIRILAVSGQAPVRSWPHVTWFEQNLEQGPADVRAGTLVSLGALRHALNQVEKMPGIGRVVAVSSALVDQGALVRNHIERAALRRLELMERNLTEACRERQITLTLLRPGLVYLGGPTGTFQPMVDYLSGRRWIALGRGGLRQPVHCDDLAQIVLDCLVKGPATEGSWDLAGGESLTIAAMVERVATVHGLEVRRFPVPSKLARRTLLAMKLSDGLVTDLARLYRHDLLPDDSPAREQLGWRPRGFRP